MSKIKSVSKLELKVKPLLKKYRVRHQPRGVFGNPDFANKSTKVAIFVNGCFWHRPCPNKCSKMPKTRQPFWKKKFRDNLRRHKTAVNALNAAGWMVGVVWECELNSIYWYLEEFGGEC